MRPTDDIERSIVELHVTTTDAMDARILNDAFGALEESLQTAWAGRGPSVWRTILWSRISKLAAAAIIVTAVLIGVKLVTGPKEEAPAPPPPVVKRVEEVEFERIVAMRAGRDVDGLVAMLKEGQFESKVLAALYLAEIGDERALPELEKLYLLAEENLPDGYRENPFAGAIEEIRNRSERKEAQAPPPDKGKVEVGKAKFTPRGVLSGLVADAKTGEPVDGAELRISGGGRIYEAVTDANGFYYLDDIEEQGNYAITVFSDEYIGIRFRSEIPFVTLRETRQAVKHFELRRGFEVDIGVVNEFGEPVEGVNLFGSWMSEYKRGRYLTDETGLATLGAIESQIEHSVTAVHDDYALAWVWTKERDVEGYYEVVMEKGVSIRGYAEHADGVPAGGLKISAHPFWGHRRVVPPRMYPIDPNGYFSLPHIAPRVYEISIHIPHGVYGETTFPVLETKLPLEDDGLLAVEVPRKSPEALASISGTFRFIGEGRPDRVDVMACPVMGQEGCETNYLSVLPDEGMFIVDSLNPGVYELDFSGPNLEWKRIERVEAPSSGLEVELRYAVRPELTGVVVRSDMGKPVRRFMAQASKLKTLRGAAETQSDFWYEFDDAEGRFNIKTVGPGIYQIQVAAEGFARAWSEEINTDENWPVVIELRKGGTIKGKVIDDDGRAIDGAKVIPLSKAGGKTKNTSDRFVSEEGAVRTKKGSFLLENLRAGRESIKVTHSDYGSAVVRDIEVIDGKTTGPVEVVLAKGGTVEGYVYDMHGQPQADAKLYFHNSLSQYSAFGEMDEKAWLSATARTDSKGFYRVEHLPEQMLYVTRSKPGSYNPQRRYHSAENWGVVSRVVVPVNGQTIELNFGGKPVIRGQLIVDSEPVAKTQVVLSGPRGFSRIFMYHGFTDAEGRFSFMGVPAGQYSIYYQRPVDKNQPWGIGDRIKVATVYMGEEDMDVGIVPEHTGRVFVWASTEDPNEPLHISSVYLQEGTSLLRGQEGSYMSKPESEGGPWVATNIAPGTYTVVAKRSHDVAVRHVIEFESDREELEVSLRLPRSTATVSGRFITEGEQPLVMWSSDEKVRADLSSSTDGTYKVEQLPAGEYFIGSEFTGSSDPLVEFSLSEGESKTIDIDTSQWYALEKASLLAQVIGDNGVPLPGALVWLEGDAGEIGPLAETHEGHLFVTEPGEYTLRVFYPDHKEATKRVQLKAKDIRGARWGEPTLIKLEKK